MHYSLCLILALTECTAVLCEMGISDGSYWAFQWYTGESFRFECNTSKVLNNSVNDLRVFWDTPVGKGFPNDFTDARFEANDTNGVYNGKLTVKDVQEPVHGVYMCHVYDAGTNDKKGTVVYGLNIHEPKYHTIMDKYRRNITIAFIATAVFLVPVATIFFVWKFQYRSLEDKDRQTERKMKRKYQGGIASTVASPEGDDAYENPDTRL
ncbi:hypothetical protein ACF0H5_010137 [Mactra antiquata]